MELLAAVQPAHCLADWFEQLAPALVPAALYDGHGHAADALKCHLHEVVTVVKVGGVLSHSDEQLACKWTGGNFLWMQEAL